MTEPQGLPMFPVTPMLYLASALLALEARAVVELRLAMLARGDAAAPTEAVRMVSEKVEIAGQMAIGTLIALAAGVPPDRVAMDNITAMRRAVGENRQRLGS